MRVCARRRHAGGTRPRPSCDSLGRRVDRSYRGARLGQLLRDLTDRFRGVNGVAAVTFSQNGIFSGIYSSVDADVPGFVRLPMRTKRWISTWSVLANPRHWRDARQGTGHRGRDRPATPSVAVVSESFARFYFGSSNPLGRTIKFDSTVTTTIVGVVATCGTTASPSRRSGACTRLPATDRRVGNEPSTAVFEIRTTGETSPSFRPPTRGRVCRPRAPIASAAPLSALIYQSVSRERLLSRLAGGFGVLALLLAAVGSMA